MKTFKVDEAFIKEAYKVANREWREKLEEQFPEAFKKETFLDKIYKTVNKEPYDHSKQYIFIQNGYLAVRMPTANREWSMENFAFINDVCTKFPEAYPVHGEQYLSEVNDHEKYMDGEIYQLVNIKHYV